MWDKFNPLLLSVSLYVLYLINMLFKSLKIRLAQNSKSLHVLQKKSKGGNEVNPSLSNDYFEICYSKILEDTT